MELPFFFLGGGDQLCGWRVRVASMEREDSHFTNFHFKERENVENLNPLFQGKSIRVNFFFFL